MGNDYIFFDESLRDRFVQFLSERSQPFDTRADTIEGFIVALRDEPDDAALEAIEALYQTLMDEQMLLAESRTGWVTHQAIGITVTRADGTTQVVRLSADLARPLLEHFSAEQAQALVQAIAHNLDHPVSGPLCRPQSSP
jgi:hypothetical protein